ncbi:biofilm regulation diguanylate cyclase SiaD [Halopseudomonas maritima]|uniref:biofilm regulation diguanylate cyclase SiaD n=1 Tax=Halopseudomonas maritima TaxID=2918528 RepID=UPI001EEA029F|nr:biofilm regulation diguanylate cyclase SiaD [Halopseudomonas maritima]UJJ30073.1 biofilm regulation diguanylate cyclase SiaD [Halopseudomonas maritima]
MKASKEALEVHIQALLESGEHDDNPLSTPLRELWTAHQDLVRRIDRISHISDGYQSLAKQREQSLAERLNKQLRQLEKVARISDRYQNMMRDLNEALREASTHDALTGLANRRLLVDRLKKEVERYARYQRSFSIAMLDVDHFKSINDRYGHEIGDGALIEIARVLDAEIRENDLCGRWGGEEFLILLPETDAAAAAQVMERVRAAIERLTIRVQDESVSMTISIGVAKHQPASSYSDTISRADHALLVAKRGGRNQLSIATE